MFGFFRKSYATLMQYFGYNTMYETRYETYIKSVYRNPSVALAYNILKNAYCNVEFKTFTIDKKTKKIVPSESTNAKLINKSLNFPSKLTSRLEFSEYMLFYYIFGGRVLIEKRNGFTSDDLLLYAPNSYEIEYSKTNAEIDKITIGGTVDIVGRELEKYHILKCLDPNSIVAGVGAGTSELEALAVLSDLVNYILKHNISLLHNRGSRGGFFKSTSETKLTQAQKEELETKLKAAIEGYQKAGKVHMLPNNVDFIQTDITPKELDWTNGLMLAHKMIAGILGVPYSLVSDEHSTYNNSKEDKVKLYKNTVIPIAKKHAEYLTRVFKDRLGDNEFVWYDVSTIEELRGETLETIKSLEGINYLTINEKRNLTAELTGIELKKYPNENADKILINGMLTPLEDLTVDIEGNVDEN